MRFGTSFLRRLAASTLRAALAGIAALVVTSGAQARSERPAAMRFFLEEAPPASAISDVPPSASGVFVARIRILKIEKLYPARWPPMQLSEMLAMLPPYKARAEIEVSAVLAGAATPGRRERVEFAPMDLDVPWVAPLPRERDTSEYFVVSFLNANGTRVLLGFPMSGEAYDEWCRKLNGPP